MDPYLEHPDLWPDVHHRLIAHLADVLAPLLRPRYRVKVEVRTYLAEPEKLTLIGMPDVSAIRINEAAVAYGTPSQPRIVQLPVPELIEEGYLEVQEVLSGEVVTVIELLSPTNKRPGAGRTAYEIKRGLILGASTHLVEVDLLRAHGPMPVYDNGHHSHYRILVSRSERRPQAELYGFDVQHRIPAFPLPLRQDDPEPLVDLNQLLHDLYDRAGYDLSIDYGRDPVPPFDGDDAAWVAELLQPWRSK